MYTGTMIEELIETVAHAEEQAQTQLQAPAVQGTPPAPLVRARDYDSSYRPMAGVA